MTIATAAVCVQAVLYEADMGHLAPYVFTNRGGFPAFRWPNMPRKPTYDELDAMLRAFDRWYRRPEANSLGWGGYSPERVRVWCSMVHGGREP